MSPLVGHCLPSSAPDGSQRLIPGSLLRIRRLAITVALVAAGSMVFGAPAVASSPTPSGYPHEDHLLVADPEAAALYLYSTTHRRLGDQLEGIEMDVHAGSLQLSDGRVLLLDAATAGLVVLDVTDDGELEQVGSVVIPSLGRQWQGAAWMATDPGERFVVLSSAYADTDTQTVSIIDLASSKVTQMDVVVQADPGQEPGEVQVYLAGTPLQLVVTSGRQFDSYPLGAVLAGRAGEPTSTAELGPYNHGPVVATDGAWVGSTTADGIDVVPVTDGRLGSTATTAYSASRNVVEVWRPRLAADGRTIWGSTAEDTGVSLEQWAETRNDVSFVGVDAGSSRAGLVRVPDGLVSRLALSRSYAMVTTINPEGDTATLIDADPGSDTYQRVVGAVALPSLADAPVAGTAAPESAARSVAITPAGDSAFVSQGGDGTITAIDTSGRRIAGTIATPTPLTAGGYLAVVSEDGQVLTDLVAR